MLRSLLIAAFLLLAGSTVRAEHPPAGVELTKRGRVNIKRVSGFKLPSVHVRQLPLPGSKRPGPIGVYELRAVPLSLALQAVIGQQQVTIENQQLLPDGQFDLDIYFWYDESNLLPILERSLRDAFDVQLELGSQIKTAYKLRAKTDDDEPPVVATKVDLTGVKILRWKGRPANVATGLGRQLGLNVTTEMPADPIAIELKITSPPVLADVERQAFEQGFVLQRQEFLYPVIKIKREE
jgi:hypothetical protein